MVGNLAILTMEKTFSDQHHVLTNISIQDELIWALLSALKFDKESQSELAKVSPIVTVTIRIWVWLHVLGCFKKKAKSDVAQTKEWSGPKLHYTWFWLWYGLLDLAFEWTNPNLLWLYLDISKGSAKVMKSLYVLEDLILTILSSFSDL